MTSRSVWQEVLGERFEELHPGLRAYYGSFPDGHVGRRRGLFDVLGTSRRWLRPFLAPLGWAGILFPVWQRDVPFTLVNTPRDGAIGGVRIFHLRHGDRRMTDELRPAPGGIIDRLGKGGRIETLFSVDVVEGRLELESRSTHLLLGPSGSPCPARGSGTSRGSTRSPVDPASRSSWRLPSSAGSTSTAAASNTPPSPDEHHA